jgi:hypothetical protein
MAELLPPLERRLDGHCVLSVHLRLRARRLPRAPRAQVFFWQRMDKKTAKDSLASSAIVQDSLGAADTDEALAGVLHHLHAARDAAVPSALLPRPGAEEPPWLTSSCLLSIEHCSEAHRDFVRLRDGDAPPDAVRHARKIYQRAFKRKKAGVVAAKLKFQDRVVARAQVEGRLWAVHDQLAGRSKHGVDSLVVDNHLLEEPSAIAEALLASFKANFRLDPKVGPAPRPPVHVPANAFLNVAQTLDLLHSLRGRKAPGLDGLPGSFLHSLAEELAAPLTVLINAVLHCQRIPAAWREAWVAAVPKKPDATSPGDYRPISVLDGLSKVYEKHLLSLLRAHLPACNASQFGFASKSGCFDALARLQQLVVQISAASTRPPKVAVLSFDVRRAFDQLPHSTITSSLAQRGAPNFLLALVQDWLGGRRMKVRCGAAETGWAEATSGCPQGSLTGPFLFGQAVDSAFDLPFSPGTALLLYADDALLVRDVSTLEGEELLRLDAALFVQHLSSLGLLTNASKSRVLIASQAPKAPKLSAPIIVGGEAVPEVTSLRYLGVLVDRRFSWTLHWAATSASAKASLGAIGRLVHWQPAILRHLVQERVVSLLLFSLGPCPPTTAKSWAQVQGVLSYAAHRLLNQWELRGLDVIKAAKLPSPKELAVTAILFFSFDCILRDRRFGKFLNPGLPAEEPRRAGLRSLACQPPTGLRPLLLPLPATRYQGHVHLLPSLLPLVWNKAAADLGQGFFADEPSKKRLASHLPHLLPAILPLLALPPSTKS